MIKAYWYPSKNVGDTLTPIILKHFTGEDIVFANKNATNKLLAVGSVMSALKNGDTVWGTGIMRETDRFPDSNDCEFLAVRGKLTEQILGRTIGVYGDPALLLPLMYNPAVKQTHEVGYVPHYVDKQIALAKYPIIADHSKFIDVEIDWQSFIREIKSCKKIVSSSLHGIIIAEAYGIPAEWVVLSNKVIGSGFKFRDYLTGTDRQVQKPGELPPIPNLPHIQQQLLASLQARTTTIAYEYPWSTNWERRNKLVASEVMKLNPRSVVDVGGGLCGLKKHLPTVDYVSIDNKQWTPDTIVADLNEQFPDIGQPRDVAICQGVLEYMTNPTSFLNNVKQYADTMVLTYRLKTSDTVVMSRSDLTHADVANYIRATGWTIVSEIAGTGLVEKLYVCHRC